MKKIYFIFFIFFFFPFFSHSNEYQVLPDTKAINNKNCSTDIYLNKSTIKDLLENNNNFTEIKAWGKNDWDLEQIEWFAKSNLSQYWVEPEKYASIYKEWLKYVFDEKSFAIKPSNHSISFNNSDDDHKKFAEHLLPLFYAYHALKHNNDLSMDENKEFLNRIELRAKNYISYLNKVSNQKINFKSCYKGNKTQDCTNGVYKMMLVRTLYGATFQDEKNFDFGEKVFQFAIEDLKEDGALWRESERSKWSWQYYTHALNLLFSIGEIYYLNGINLYDYESSKGQTIHDAVEFLSKAIDDNELMFNYSKKLTAVNHYDDYKNYKDDEYLNLLKHDGQDGYNGWLYIYAYRFPDSELTKKLIKQIELKDKIKWGYIGFDSQCFYPFSYKAYSTPFPDGTYALSWYVGWEGQGNEFLGDDEIIVTDSNIEFSKFSKKIKDISKNIRKNIQLNIINDELIISGDLDLASNGDTIQVNLRGKNEFIQKDDSSVPYFELEGNWDRDIIRVRLTPKN